MNAKPSGGSFDLKVLLIEMTALTSGVKTCLELLAREGGAYIDLDKQNPIAALETAAKAFKSKCGLNLPALMWQVAVLELPAREAHAVTAIRKRIAKLAARTFQEPFRSWENLIMRLKP